MNPVYEVSYFGLLGERRGIPVETVSHAAASAEDLYQELDAIHNFGLAIANLRAAVNDEFVPWGHPLKDGDRIAFLPPMSGG
jgi:molybdopterin converting factor small subunit